MKEKEKGKAADLDFEKALADLEQVVEQLEKGGLSLNESLGRFEHGVRLSRFLRSELDNAEKKIEILMKDEKGGVHPVSFSLEEAEGADAVTTEAAVPVKKASVKVKKIEDDGGLPF
jgi:exodeoxyribonuclease VII small subunit